MVISRPLDEIVEAIRGRGDEVSSLGHDLLSAPCPLCRTRFTLEAQPPLYGPEAEWSELVPACFCEHTAIADALGIDRKSIYNQSRYRHLCRGLLRERTF